jgi:DNA-dependent protein kinase catalytic subunit
LETVKTGIDISNVLVFLIEKVLYLACDLEKSINKIFEPLLYQIIHWIAKKGSLNSSHKEILSIIDILIENSSAHQNLKIREISSQCTAEYIKWFIKQHTDHTIKEKNSTIKYLIRTVESYAQHPDPFRRLGAVMCFDKLIVEISQSDVLIDKFVIEIASYCFAVLKISYNSKELQDIILNYVISVNLKIK